MKTKILIIVENTMIPYDPRVWKEATSLYQQGYEVTILCPRGKRHREAHIVLDGIHIYKHPMVEEGNSRFGHLFEFVCALFWEFWYTWWIYFQRGFHVIQGCNPPDTIFLVALPFKLLGVKYIFDHHDVCPELFVSKYGKQGLLYKVLVWLEKMTFRTSDVVMATNNSYRELAITRGGVDPNDVFVVRNGPDLQTFKAVPPNPALKGGKPYLIGYVGMMNVQDGLDILLNVALHIKSLGRRDVRFRLVGSGPDLPGLRKMLVEKGLDDLVEFTGYIPDEEMIETLSTADVCVNPDRPCQMNNISTMIKIMEYMALGKPIVQFQSKEGKFSAQEASLYADPQHLIEDFAAKILWLLDHPDERKRMGEFGRKRVEEELAWDYSVKNLFAAYQRALAKGHADRFLEGPSARQPWLGVLGTMNNFNKVIIDYFRCPDELLAVGMVGNLSRESGFFKFGKDLICFGKCSAFAPSATFNGALQDARECTRVEQGQVSLPFHLSEVVGALRREQYTAFLGHKGRIWSQNPILRTGYYLARPLLPVSVRKYFQRLVLRGWHKHPFPRWPVDTTVEDILESTTAMILQERPDDALPFIWFWPEGKQACAVMTHDVETTAGRDFCECLMDVDDSFGIKASFQVVPERRYKVPEAYLASISKRGFEVNVQDLNHDGRLFDDYEEFQRRRKAINEYAGVFKARGFRSAILYRNVDWLASLSFEYDMSVPNVAHLDPQQGGCCTIFPYFVGDILEIPVTMTQDYTLFHILRDYSLDLWREQARRILARHGVMNFIVHPDYVTEDREMQVFKDLLAYLAELRTESNLWTPLPREVSEWWRQRSRMQLVKNGSGWGIVGEGKERARLAYARLKDGKLVYDLR